MISIVIPTFNDSKTIDRAIYSILAQTYKDWEIVVVNDHSTDDTIEHLERFKKMGINLRYVTNERNMGVGVSRKVGFMEAKGEFVTFLDADDYLMCDFLDVSTKLQEQQDADVVYTSFTVRFAADKFQYMEAPELIMEGEATPQMHFQQPMKFLTGKLIRKTLLEKVPWSTNRIGEDVQTIFYLTYHADKVRSSKYSGYVHCFREGSLLANAPKFFCFVWGAAADHEIIDYLLERGEEKLYMPLLKMAVLQYNQNMEKIRKKEIKKKEVRDNQVKFNECKAWFYRHRDLLDKLDDVKLDMTFND